MQNFCDYKKDEISHACFFLEQYCKHEKDKELKIALHVLRAVRDVCNRTNSGTEWLSKLSGTEDKIYASKI